MKVLQLQCYPTIKPQHGGQIRNAALKRALVADGIEVQSISIFDSTHYADYGAGDMPLPHEFFQPYADEWPWGVTIGRRILSAPECFADFEKSVLDARADVYEFEQPWLWPAVKEVFSRNPAAARPVIYSSQNIEYVLLQDILEADGSKRLDGREVGLVKLARELEGDLVSASKLVVACTKTDEEVLRREFGAKDTVCFPNGIDPVPELSEAGRKWFNRWFAPRSWAAFVGSAHPPNAEGFRRLCGDNLGYLAPDQSIAILGGVGDLLHAWANENIFSALNSSRCLRTGRLEAEHLNAAIRMSKVILLPILTGGGSNLKTAEALVSGKPILATSLAFRGYEEFKALPTVNIVDDPCEWKLRLRELLSAEKLPSLDAGQRALTERCLWVNILRNYPRVIRRIAPESPSSRE